MRKATVADTGCEHATSCRSRLRQTERTARDPDRQRPIGHPASDVRRQRRTPVSHASHTRGPIDRPLCTSRGNHANLRTHTQDGGSVRVASRGRQTMADYTAWRLASRVRAPGRILLECFTWSWAGWQVQVSTSGAGRPVMRPTALRIWNSSSAVSQQLPSCAVSWHFRVASGICVTGRAGCPARAAVPLVATPRCAGRAWIGSA